MAELVALMKTSADKPLSYCTPGNGSLYHLIGERLNSTAGVKSIHVPYSGFPQCMTDLIGGNVDFAFLPLAGPFPGAVDSGGIRAVAMLSHAPSARFPKVPVASATRGFEGSISRSGRPFKSTARSLTRRPRFSTSTSMPPWPSPKCEQPSSSRASIVSPPMTLKQAQDEYLKEIEVFTAMFKSVGLPKQ